MSTCPFMALQQASSHDAGQKKGDPPLTCPISGKRAPSLDQHSSRPEEQKSNRPDEHQSSRSEEQKSKQSNEDRSRRRGSVCSDEGWLAGNSTHLGAIVEEPEDFNEDSEQITAFSRAAAAALPTFGLRDEFITNDDDARSVRSAHSGIAGSCRSSQMGSVLSGMDLKMPGGSRISKGSKGQSSRHSSKASGKRKKILVTRMREASKTTPPTYSLAELRLHGPQVKASWALLLVSMPWDQLGVRLYESIFEFAPSLQEMFSKSSLAMGIKMVDMIDSMVNGLDDMAGVHKKMESLGPVHHRNSVHALEHMSVFETVVIELLQSSLGEKFNSDMRKGWHWLWCWLTESMLVVEKLELDKLTENMPVVESAVTHFQRHLQGSQPIEAYNTSASIIQQSWDAVADLMPLEALGDAIYEKVFEMAPNLRHLFSKPKQIMSMKLVNIVAMLVSLSTHPETVDEVISDLGKRHVTYGVASFHVPIMKQAIMAVLEQVLGELWTADTVKAWSELWEASCAAMMKAIDEGREHGAAIETVWQKVMGKSTPQKFALQLYSRLTNASPELVLVFMKAGSGDAVTTGEDEETSGGVKVAGGNFGTGGGAFATPASAAGARRRLSQDDSTSDIVVQAAGTTGGAKVGDKVPRAESVGRKALMRAASRLVRPGGGLGGGAGGAGAGTGMFSSKQTSSWMSRQRGTRSADAGNRKSAFSTVLDAIERVTGLDLDGDGTVGGDVLAEEDDMDLAGATGGAKKRFSRLAWGLEIWDLISVSVDLLYEPELLKQRLTVIAARFFGYGCRPLHLKSIGMALQGVIGEILIIHTKTPWSASESLAWDWFWAHVENSIRRTLEAYEQGVAERVTSDWKAIRAAHTDEEFGDIFYSELQEAAPEMLRLFVRPRRLQFSTFVEFVSLLVRFASGPEEYYQQVKPMAIRHMKHGVTAQSVKPFGTALLAVLKRTLGDKYDTVSQKAWDYVWTSVSRCMADCLNVGSNLVTVALVTGEVEELQRALDLAPRGQRADWVTRVQIHDSVISPLYWAVRDGKVDMARLMIRDLLSMRADREAYYYGYDQLWDVHPDIVGVLCKLCPALLEDLFDGMMWHSGSAGESGEVRVNYYVRALYGDPDANPDAWAAPFGVLALQGPPSIFVHPIVVKVLDLKWQRFAMYWFLAIEGWYTLILAAYEAVYVIMDSKDCRNAGARLGVGALAVVTFAIQTVVLLGQIRGGQVGPVRIIPFVKRTFPLPRWLHKKTNAMRLISMVMLAVVAFYDPCLLHGGIVDGGSATEALGVTGLDILTAVLALLLWGGTFQLFTLNHRLSAFIFTTGVLVSDVSRVIAVLIILILAFSTALTRLEQGESLRGFDNLPNAAFTLIRRILQLDPLPTEGFSVISWIFFLLFAMMSIIGMINILIAQLSETVSALAARSEAFAIQHRVHLALEVESMLSLSKRQRIWSELQMSEPLPFDEGYLGPSGGVQCLESAEVMLHPKYVQDRVVRVRGEASPLLPWPTDQLPDDKGNKKKRGDGDGEESEGSEADYSDEDDEDPNEPSFDRPPAD